MPIDTHELKTRSGHPVLRATFKGTVTLDEAKRYHQPLLPGGPFEHYGHLVTGAMSELSNEVRKELASQQANPTNPPPVALIIPSALMRMLAGLVMRMSGNDNTEYFRDEAPALEWLDERLTAYHRLRRAPAK